MGGPAAAAAESAESAEVLVTRGRSLYAEGRLDEALAVLRAAAQAAERSDSRRDAHLFIGVCLLAQGKASEAAASFREALADDPASRLDKAMFPPQVVEAFEAVRRETVAKAAPSVVTLTRVESYFSPAEKRPALEMVPWYKKWWVWAIAGVAVAGGVAAASGGGGGGGTDTYDPPTVNLDVITTPISGISYCAGDIDVSAAMAKGEPPYTLTWYLTVATQPRQTLASQSTSAVTASYTYAGLSASGPCVDHNLEVGISDKRNNNGNSVSSAKQIRVCLC